MPPRFVQTVIPLSACILLCISLTLILLSSRKSKQPSPFTPRTAAEKERIVANLNCIASHRIFFAHQSVGANIIEGLRELSSEVSAPLPLYNEQTNPCSLPSGALIEIRLGENGDPEGKIHRFASHIRSGIGDYYSVAFMKFCYVDIGPTTDTDSLFSIYHATLDSINREFPSLLILHCEVPLQAKNSGIRGLIRSIIGKNGNEIANSNRMQFNRILENSYPGRIIDIANIESTDPDGRVVYDRKGVKALSKIYTNDGGHLNALGRKTIAIRFAEHLAIILQNHFQCTGK